MKFRDHEVDQIEVVVGNTKEHLIEQLKVLLEEKIAIDLQYGIISRPLAPPSFTALVLLKNKEEVK